MGDYMWEIEFYETQNNTIPVQDFLNSLDKKMRAKAIKEILLLKDLGTLIREPYSKHIKDGVFELRIKFGSNISRIFYFFFVGDKIVLTNGFIKKSQKTPQEEITKALKYKLDYIRRNSYDKF